MIICILILISLLIIMPVIGHIADMLKDINRKLDKQKKLNRT